MESKKDLNKEPLVTKTVQIINFLLFKINLFNEFLPWFAT